MAVFSYKALDTDGKEREGTIDAVSIDVAISALQHRGLIISKIDPVKAKDDKFKGSISMFDRITHEDVVMLSRQMSTLFQAKVSSLRAFQLLAAEARTQKLAEKLGAIASEVESGSTLSNALAQHPDVFSPFYVNMVKAGEASGKFDEIFAYLAGYEDRNYQILSKARNALIYPAFIIFTFVTVMVLMLTLVIPNIAKVLLESGQQPPLPTRIVLGASGFLTHYFFLIAIAFAIGGFVLYRYSKTDVGKETLARTRLQLPAIGTIYRKIFVARIADNLATMQRSGIQILRALEITAEVVGDPVYKAILLDAANDVKGGLQLSTALRKHPEMPGILVSMVAIGEESGRTGTILETIADFYRREVDNAVDTLVGLIEPVMIVMLAVGVGVLLAAVLLPIYNLTSSI